MKQYFKHTVRNLSFVSLLFTHNLVLANNLPVIGDYSSSIVSLNTEHNLGQGIIRKLRAANQSVNDPIVESYIQDLTWDLVTTSQLSDKRISLTVIDSLSVNAFAAPGGVLGIHSGLIMTAKAEDELASVISHELAHLSQRHFAAQLEQQRINTPLAIATMLTGLLVASANPEAGSAVISSGIANQAFSQLAFTRRNEQTADRIGMLNLSKAGYSPDAMPRMFQRLLELQRLQGSFPPEFLLTHPSSGSRVADSRNRAAQLPKKIRVKKTLDFDIVKARLIVQNALRNKLSSSHFKKLAQSSKSNIDKFTYALAAAQNRKYAQSIAQFSALSKSWRNHLLVKLSLAQVYKQDNQISKALSILKKLNALYPKHTAIQTIYAQTLLAAQQPLQAVKQLTQITKYAPDNVQAWYLLAEAHGLAGNRNALHIARIEYFLLNGQVQQAKTQISFARRERSLKQPDIYKLDDLEQEAQRVDDYLNTRF